MKSRYEYDPKPLPEKVDIAPPSRQVETQVRNAVLRFAKDMELRLQANDHKGGWEDENFSWLLSRINDEFGELEECYEEMEWIDPCKMNNDQKREMISELADIANFAMMCAHKIRQEVSRRVIN